MAEQEIIRIINVDTSQSVKSLEDMKKAAQDDKDALKDLDRTTVEYDLALAKSKKSQQDYNYALRMTTQDAKEAKGSYNSLVAELGRLKQEWRATTDATQRANIGGKIADINDQLKKLDASVGVYSRNVGDYANQMKGALRDVPSYANAIKGPLKDVTDQAGLLGKQPLFGIITLITPLVIKIVDELKESENAMQALNKISKAFQPVLSFFENIISTLAGYLGDIVQKVLEFTQGGLFQKIINGVVGVGNAILKFVVAPFKGIVAAIQVFKEQGVKGLGDAARAFAQEMKQGVAFKSNFEAGQTLAQTLVAGAVSKKKEAGAAIAQAIAEEVRSELMKVDIDAIDRKLDEARRKRQEEQRAFDAEQLEYEKRYQAELDGIVADATAGMLDHYQEQADAAQRKRDNITASEKAIESVLGSVANAYNTQIQAQLQAGKISEQEARKRFAFVKAFQLTQAVINTASGIMSAFSAPDNITMVQKIASAATVAAQGAASIASIASSSIGTGAQASNAQQVTGLMNAGQSAPAVQQVVPITRVGTNAEDVDTFNQLQRSQRVYVVYSDIAEAGAQVQVQTAESTF